MSGADWMEIVCATAHHAVRRLRAQADAAEKERDGLQGQVRELQERVRELEAELEGLS